MKRTTFSLLLVFLLIGCGPDKFIKKGQEAAAIGEWYEAASNYALAYSTLPSTDKEKRGMVAFKVGESNRKYNYVAKALMGYRNAARYKYVDTLTYFQLAEMERISKDYKQAAKDYETFLEQ